MRILLLVFCCFSLLASPSLFAQLPQGDIRPMLKSLTKPQKLQILEYLRHLGSDIDEEIQQVYRLQSAKNQRKTIDFLETLRLDKGELPTTAVQWNRDTAFFGEIVAGLPVIDSFRVTNTGQHPYLISHTKTTCDCMVLKVPEHPVMPGESAIVRVEFNSQGKAGTAIPALILYDNSAPNKRSILYLKGRILPRRYSGKNPWDD